MLDHWYCPTAFQCTFFFLYSSLCVSLWVISIDLFSNSLILSIFIASLLINLSKVVIMSVIVVFPIILIWFFLILSISLIKFPSCFNIFICFSTKAFHIIISTILNSLIFSTSKSYLVLWLLCLLTMSGVFLSCFLCIS